MYTLNPDIVAKKIQNETAILNVLTGQYFVLNEVATHAWNQIQDGQLNIDAIAQSLFEKFDVDAETARKDAEELVSTLKEKQILTEA